MSASKSRPNGKKWSCEEIDLVLKIYREHYEHLWNRKHKAYEDREMRKVSLEKFREDLCQLGIYAPDIKYLSQKLKTIRETYRQELNKACGVTNRSDKFDVYGFYEPSLYWFDTADSFLRDNINMSKISLSKASPKTEEDNLEPEVVFQNEDNVEESDIHMEFQNDVETNENLSELQVIAEDSNTNRSPRGKSRRMRRSIRSKVKDLKPEVHSESKQHFQCMSEGDEYDIFSKHVVSQLKKLPIQSFVVLQEKIQSLITQERLKVMRETQECSNTLTSTTDSLSLVESLVVVHEETFDHSG